MMVIRRENTLWPTTVVTTLNRAQAWLASSENPWTVINLIPGYDRMPKLLHDRPGIRVILLRNSEIILAVFFSLVMGQREERLAIVFITF